MLTTLGGLAYMRALTQEFMIRQGADSSAIQQVIADAEVAAKSCVADYHEK